ncbi:MAG: phosphopantetheine-binding protein [Trichodesmium sp. St7_bin2_1]|nr:phosphopantetheine-binding protein [Trichodesmium sp. St7_bin2_1]
MSEIIIAKLKKIISEELDVNLGTGDIDENTPLLESGEEKSLGLDSITIVELISLIEQGFEIEFSDSELNPENFTNLKILADYITSKKETPSLETVG